MKRTKTVKGLNVYHNDKLHSFIPSRDRDAMKIHIRDFVRSTHMGEWIKRKVYLPENPTKEAFEAEYATTIGLYIRFVPAVREHAR